MTVKLFFIAGVLGLVLGLAIMSIPEIQHHFSMGVHEHNDQIDFESILGGFITLSSALLLLYTDKLKGGIDK